MNARLRSWLEMGILAELRCPDVEMRIAILEMKAAAEQAAEDQEVLWLMNDMKTALRDP